MDGEQFVSEFRKYLSEDNRQEVLNLCKNTLLIKENSWEVILAITNYLTEEIELEQQERFEFCKGILKCAAEKCIPEDAVLILHKELADTKDDSTFLSILEPLKYALLRLPKNRPKYAIWCFSAIQMFLNNLPEPDNFNLEEKERVLMDADADVHRIANIYKKIWEFYINLLDYYKDTDKELIVIKYIIQLLGTPMIYLDLKMFNNTKSLARRIAEEIAMKITSFSDPFKFVTWHMYHKIDEEDLEVPKIALLTFYYLILFEKAGWELTPKVYNPVYIFQNILHFISEIFQFEHQFIIEKGLDLCEVMLTSTCKQSFSYLLLDDPVHKHFCVGLSRVMIFSPLKHYRQKALHIFKLYLYNFDNKGRYLLIYNNFNEANHSGFMGYLITQYKEMLNESFKNKSLDLYFQGGKFLSLVKQFCYLHEGEKSDIMELADQIIPALNFLRYLAIRDKKNLTGIWDYFEDLRKEYFEPLKKGLILSKAHYEFKIKELQEEAAKGEAKANASKVSVTIAGQELPDMTVGEKMNVLKSSMTAFDVIESLLSRLNEFVGNDKL